VHDGDGDKNGVDPGRTGQRKYIVQKVDTAAIIREYEVKRFYSETLFNNQYGKPDVSFTLQYNKISGLRYDFIPFVSAS
jgi:hypothetical protein